MTAAGNGGPLVEARVFLVGGASVTSTNSDGRYVLRSSPGPHEVRVLRVGYSEQKRPVDVPVSGVASLDIVMSPTVVRLTEIVTTATGTQRRTELGNSVQTFGDIAKNVEQAPVKNLADLIVGKAPGVQVQGANMTGGAPVVRIRGIKSLSLTSEPIYVIDGVRMNNNTVGINTGGTTVSMLNILNPEEIADIEIVKGPSAATLYGTDAANGVIVITTKRGLAGPARWVAHAGYGSVQDRNDYPTQYAIFGRAVGSAPGATPLRCTTTTMSTTKTFTSSIAPSCVADSTTSYNLLADPDISPIHDGNTKQLGLQVSGGSDAVRYFVTGDFEGERGPLELPTFSQRFLDSTGNPLRESILHPETFSRKSVRGNTSATVNPKLDITFNSGFTRTAQQLPPIDNSTASFLYNAYNNPGFKPTIACQTNAASCLGYTNKGALSEELGGYGFFTPGNLFQRLNTLNADRFLGSTTSQYRPFGWLQGDATLGYDIASRDVTAACRRNECQQSGVTREGLIFFSKTTERNLSAKGSGTATWQMFSTLNSRTTVGTDYVNIQTEFASAEGDNVSPGAQTAGAGAVQFAGSSFTRGNKTLGFYAQEQLGFRDRLFVTLAARSDQNSAFGTKFQRVVYPKGSVSYVISDEGFFPKFSWLDQLRLRGAYGTSGVQPNATTALQTYGATSINLGSTPTAITGADIPGILGSALGNPELKPERSSERELGFETRMFGERFNVDFTYYNNLTKDALINQPIAPSSGASSTGLAILPSVTRNLGSIRNSGIEASITTTLVNMRSFGWDLTVGGSHNTNKIESLGLQPCVPGSSVDCVDGMKSNPTIGTGDNRDSLGLTVRGIFVRDYTFNDANNDHIITADEVFVDSLPSYIGSAVPRDLVTVQSGIDLFSNKMLHLNVLLDYKGGFSLFNSTGRFFCLNNPTCYDLTHPEAPLADQARAVALKFQNPNQNPAVLARPTTSRGYYENGQFWRLREVGATLNMPSALANQLRAHDASLTVSGRNLHVWTKYTGTDPESGYTVDNLQNVQNDFATISPPTYFAVRLNLHY